MIHLAFWACSGIKGSMLLINCNQDIHYTMWDLDESVAHFKFKLLQNLANRMGF